MSVLQYNGYFLKLLRTLEFGVEPERDPSGTDMMWNKYTLRVRGILDTSPGDGIPINGPAKLEELKHKLMIPRRNISYQVGNTILLYTNGIDACLGPEPLYCRIREITAGVFFVEWACIVRLADCGNNPSASEVVSLRWSQTEEYDENWFTTITTNATIITRTDMRGLSADSFRELAVPPVPGQNFRRQVQRCTLDETGTKLRVEVRDQEQERLPPSLATRANGRFTVVSNKMGAMRVGQVDLRLEGPPGVGRHLLIQQATAIALSKLLAAGPAGQNLGIPPPIDFVIMEELYSNVVEVRLKCLLSAQKAPMVTTANKNMFGDTPGSPPVQPSITPPQRLAIAGLVVAAFRDPCSNQGSQVKTIDLRGGPGANDPTQWSGMTPSGVAPTVDMRTSGPDGAAPDEPLLRTGTEGEDPGDYDHLEVTSEYRWNEGKAQLPAAVPGGKSKVVQVHGGGMVLLVDWSAKRRGTAPVLPSYHSPLDNFVPMGGFIIPEKLEYLGDNATPVHTVSGHYEYAVIDPSEVSIVAPVPPFLSERAAAAAKDTAGFYSDKILWKFQSADGPNPFLDPPRGNFKTLPDNKLAQQFAQPIQNGIDEALSRVNKEINGGGNGGKGDVKEP